MARIACPFFCARTAKPLRYGRGVALVAVMWIVAALTILVGSLLTVSRSEVRAAQTKARIGEATALGDAAIQVALLRWRTAPAVPDRLLGSTLQIDGVSVGITVVPGSGYIDINSAPEALLRDMFIFGASLAPDRATMLAQRIVDWRDTDDTALQFGAETDAYVAAGVSSRPRNSRFLVPEDLMQVLGVDFELFDIIRPFVTVWSDGGQGVNALAAPPEVLAVLAQGNHDTAVAIARARDAGSVAIDTTGLEQAHLNGGPVGNMLHVLASIAVGEGLVAQRGRWVLLSPDEAGAPWRTLAAEPIRFVEVSQGGH